MPKLNICFVLLLLHNTTFSMNTPPPLKDIERIRFVVTAFDEPGFIVKHETGEEWQIYEDLLGTFRGYDLIEHKNLSTTKTNFEEVADYNKKMNGE